MSCNLLSGGITLGRLFRVALIIFITSVSITAADAAPVSKKIAVLMFKPQNYGTEWVSPATVRDVVWTGTASANAFYKEVSYGKWQLTGKARTDGDVYGWYTVPYNDDGSCAIQMWMAAARTMAAKEGFDALGYDALVYVTKATGCPGRAWASGTSVVVISGFGAGTVLHELGHTFGLEHASSWKCKDSTGTAVTISSTCSANEYGDFAAMGATGTKHFNAYHKGQLGFFVASNTRDVTASGVYAISPLEEPTSNVQALRIPRTYDAYGNVKDYYYMEFRQPYGFDKFSSTSQLINGVVLHVAPPYTSRAHSFLLDATTPSLTTFGDAALLVGNTFTDTVRKVSVTVLSVSPAAAYVDVKFNP